MRAKKETMIRVLVGLLLLGVSSQGEPGRVILIGIDGLGGDWFEESNSTNMKKLRDQGAFTLEMQNVIGTSSSQNWFSMVGGAGPDVHGVYTNGWERGDSLLTPTIFASLRHARPNATSAAFYHWGGFGRLVEDWAPDVKESPGDQRKTTDAAVEYLVAEQPNLLFVHLDHVDGAGHSTFWGSSRYFDAVQEADELVGEIVEASQKAGVYEETTFIISADHGGNYFGSHGADRQKLRNIPFIISGPPIRPGYQIQRETRIFDIAATVLEVLEVPAPSNWTARPVFEAFKDYVFPSPPNRPLKMGFTTEYTFVYDSSGELNPVFGDFSLWRPVVPEGSVILGDVAVKGLNPPSFPTPYLQDDPELLTRPTQYEQIFNNDKFILKKHPLSLWSPVPQYGYVCLGDIGAQKPQEQPPRDLIRCLHESLVEKGEGLLLARALGLSDLENGQWMSLWAVSGSSAISPNTFISRRDLAGPGYPKFFLIRDGAVTPASAL